MLKIVVLILFFLSFLSAQNLQHINLQLKWKHQFQFAGFYTAKELGYYKEAGLDVDFRELDTKFNTLKDLNDGIVNFVIDDSSTIYYKLQGADIVGLLPVFQSSPISLFTQKEFNTLESLEGKSIEFSSNELSNISINALLKSHNIKVTPKLHTFYVKDFEEKKPDGIVGYLSNQPFFFKSHNISYNEFTPKDYGFNFYGDMVFTSKNYAQQNPILVKKFIEATKKGWEYAFENIPQTSQLIHTKYNTQKKSIEALIYEGEVLKKLSGYGKNFGEFEKERIKEIGNTISLIFPQKFRNTNLDDFIWDADKNLTNFYKNTFIKTNSSFNVCIKNDSYPLEGADEGKLIGIAGEILNKIAKDFDFKLNIIENKTIEELLTNVENKKCDILTSVGRKEYEQFEVLEKTLPYLETNFAIITKADKPFMENIKYLENKKFVTKYTKYESHLKTLYSKIDIQKEENLEKIIDKFEKNQIDGYIVNNITADRIIEKMGYEKFKISGFLANEHTLQSSFGVLKNKPELLEILNLGLSQFSQNDLEKIKDTYKVARYKTIVDSSLIMEILAIFGIIMVGILLFIRTLKKHNKELNEWINATIEGVALFENGKLIKANRQLLKILGYEKFEEIYGKTYFDFIAPSNHHIITPNLKLSNTEPYELIFVKRDGTFINALVRGHTIEGTNRRISTIIDITELKNTQEKLHLLNQTLQDKIKEEVSKNEQQQAIMFQQGKLAENGLMLNMIAHQWRQPLNHLSLIFNNVLLKHRMNTLDKESIEKYKLNFQTQLLYMSNTIDDFQNFFKPRKERETFLLREMILTTFTLVKPLFDKNSIQFVLNSTELIRHFGFKNELAQVILCLLNNSKDALIENKINNKILNITLSQTANEIIIKVEDNAGGIKDEYLNKIFDPYFSTKNEKNGTGLGLYMAKTIINKHFEGDIFAKNINNGLEMTIIFPKKEI